MKHKRLKLALAAVGVPALTLSLTALEVASEGPAADAAAEMELKQDQIGERIEMSAPMDLEQTNGIDPLAEAIDKGMIVEITLAEAEAELAAAAATADPQDDAEASERAHFGSFRFFPDGDPSVR
jgi:hypothetical protein